MKPSPAASYLVLLCTLAALWLIWQGLGQVGRLVDHLVDRWAEKRR